MAASDWPVLAGQSFLVRKAPNFKTEVKTAVSGREIRRPLWSYPFWRFGVRYEVIREKPTLKELSLMLAFFGGLKGQANALYFLDPNDKTVALGQNIGTGNGTNRTFQLTRTISATVNGVTKTFTEPVLAVNGSPTVQINGVTTTAYVLNPYGVVVFNSAPANGAVLTWGGEFLFVCRLERDEFEPSEMVSQLWSLDGLDFRSIKP